MSDEHIVDGGDAIIRVESDDKAYGDAVEWYLRAALNNLVDGDGDYNATTTNRRADDVSDATPRVITIGVSGINRNYAIAEITTYNKIVQNSYGLNCSVIYKV